MKKLDKILLKALKAAFILALLAMITHIAITRIGSLFTSSSRDIAVYENVDFMSYGRTDIVRAVILDRRVVSISHRREHPYFYTVNRIAVLEVFKGDAQVGDIMEISQLRRHQPFRIINTPDPLSFSRGDDVILFMGMPHRSHITHLPASLLAGGQGVYRAISSCGNRFDEGIIAAYHESPQIAYVEFEDFSPNSVVQLTVGDLMLIRYEAGLGPRPYNLQPPEDVDRSRLLECIARAEHHLPQKYMLPGWDDVQILLDEAIRVRDNPYSRQIHVNHASFDLRYAMRRLGINTNAPVPGSHPTIIGSEP